MKKELNYENRERNEKKPGDFSHKLLKKIMV